MRRPYTYLWWTFLGVIAIAMIGLEVLTRINVDPVVIEHVQVEAKHLSHFLADQDELKKIAFFQPVTGHRDAGEWLNTHLSWTPKLQSWPEDPARIAVPEKWRSDMFKYGSSGWIQKTEHFKRYTPDLSFFKKLLAYDYWDIETLSPIGQLNDKKIFVPPSRLPIPDTWDLLILAKIRLLQATKTHDELAALTEVHHLAELMASTENMRLQLSSITLLEIERIAYQHYVEKKWIADSDWQPIGRETSHQANRVIWATRGYLRIWTPPELIKSIYLEPKVPPVGFCAAVNESLPNEWVLKPLLDSHWPMERNFRSDFVMLEQVYHRAQESCRIRYLSSTMKDDNFSDDLSMPIFLTFLPYSRKLFGLKISTFHFEGFDAYNREEASRAHESDLARIPNAQTDNN
jgi:hypothetical protein